MLFLSFQQELYRENMMIKEKTKNKETLSSVLDCEQLYRNGIKLNQDQDQSHRNVHCLPSLQVSGIIIVL